MEMLNQRPEIIAFIKSVAQEHKIEDCVITNVKINDKGEGYMGQIFFVTVQDPSNTKKLEILIKASFTDENIRKFLPVKVGFENEVTFYTKIYPFFKKFEQECGVVDDDTIVPKCYKTLLENETELLCLENLKNSKFELFEKSTVLDDEHMSLIFKTYGRFHAYSFALQDQKPEDYAELVSKLTNVQAFFLKDPTGFFKNALKAVAELVKKFLIPGEDDAAIKRFEKYEGDGSPNIYAEGLLNKCNYSAILHGDCWSNNIMFKYENVENKKKLTDLRLLDFQIMREGSPVCDLSYCIYSGASKSVLDNLEQYLKIYHDSFSSFLRKLGSDPEKLFPFNALKEEWKKYANWGMISGLSLWRNKLTKKEDVLDLSDLKADQTLDLASVKFDEEEYGKRVRDIVRHMLEIDAL